MYFEITKGYLKSDGFYGIDDDKINYTIMDGSPRSDFSSKTYVVCRNTTPWDKSCENIDEGYLDHNGNVVCGSGSFCAGGPSKEMLFDSLIDAIKICEQDKENIENGIVKNYLDPKIVALKKDYEISEGFKPEYFYFVFVAENENSLRFDDEKETVIAFMTKWEYEEYNISSNPNYGLLPLLPRRLEYNFLTNIDGHLYMFSHDNDEDFREELIKLGFTEKPEMIEKIKEVYNLK